MKSHVGWLKKTYSNIINGYWNDEGLSVARFDYAQNNTGDIQRCCSPEPWIWSFDAHHSNRFWASYPSNSNQLVILSYHPKVVLWDDICTGAVVNSWIMGRSSTSIVISGSSTVCQVLLSRLYLFQAGFAFPGTFFEVESGEWFTSYEGELINRIWNQLFNQCS